MMPKDSRLATFTPQDPVGFGENDDDWWPVYSDRDQAEYDRLLALDLEDAHRERMREYHDRLMHSQMHLDQMLEAMRQTMMAARANDHWDYVAAEDGELVKRDELMVSKVALELQQFYAQHSMSNLTQMNLQHQQFKEMTDLVTGDLTHVMTGMVYGHPHKPILTKQSKEITWEVPASWWQMFRRDVLGRKKIQMVQRSKTFSMSVSAKPFSAFPELPYVAPDNWGPRIDLVLQTEHPYIRGAWDKNDRNGLVHGG